MYHPYFRGKKNEILAIRETALLMSEARITPIIEPVRNSLKDVELALQSMCDAGGHAILVINPQYGDHVRGESRIISLLEETLKLGSGVSAGIILSNKMDVSQAISIYSRHKAYSPNFIHAGFHNGKELAEVLDRTGVSPGHIFFEEYCSLFYRETFSRSEQRVLLRDGFKKRRNVDYPPVEMFSDLNVIYKSQSLSGFGDFLIVGDEYTESGGPAYAVAIHISFIDPDNGGAMYVYHFVSDENDLPINPAGKFAEALNKLIEKLNSGGSKICETTAISEFRELHKQQHFPGLGTVKKICLKHHIETFAARPRRV